MKRRKAGLSATDKYGRGLTTYEIPEREVDYLFQALETAIGAWSDDPDPPFGGYELDRAIDAMKALEEVLENRITVIIPGE